MSEQVERVEDTKTKVVKVPPTISIDDTDLPDIKDWEVSHTYDIILHVEMVGKHQGSEYGLYNGDDKLPNRTRARLKVLSVRNLDSTNNKPSGKLKVINKRLEN